MKQQKGAPGSTLIYSPFPSVPLSPPCIRAIYRESVGGEPSSCDLYHPLPWPLASLAQTSWRHVRSGTLEHIQGMSTGSRGQPIPIAPSRFHSKYTQGFGRWQDGRYLLEEWTRVDHLPTAMQLAWFGVEIDFLCQQLALLPRASELEAVGQGGTGARRRLKRRIASARTQMVAFAEQQGLPLPLDLLNSGFEALARIAPLQLVLFGTFLIPA